MIYIKRFAAITVSVILGMIFLVSIPVLAAPPYGGSVTIGPDPAYTDGNIIATLSDWIETDVVGEMVYGYEWHKSADGVTWVIITGATEATLLSSDTTKGDHIKVICTPSDDTGDGTPVESNEIIISNKPPEGGSVTIGSEPAYSDTDLTATPSDWTDADGDEITYEYEWQYWDGDSWELIVGAPTGDTLDSSYFEYGDRIRIACTPFDGTDYGIAVESNEIDIVSYSISIDVKPGSSVNPINLGSKGVIPVAIITTEDFDATTVDVGTVRFGLGEAQVVHSAIEDVDDDGDVDILRLEYEKENEEGWKEIDAETGETLRGERWVHGRHQLWVHVPGEGTESGHWEDDLDEDGVAASVDDDDTDANIGDEDPTIP